MSENNEKNENNEIKEFGTNSDTVKESGIQVLSIVGQIEGHYVSDQNQKTTKYEHIIPLLVAMEQSDDVKGILIVLNTMGGDVEAGLGIAEIIASMSKPTVSLVIGGSHSIGVPLAVSAKHSFIVPSATMTIHPVRVNGLVVGAPQTYNYFADMQKRIVGFICRHSKATEHSVNEMMMRPDMLATDVGTVLEGIEAVACGIIDEIGGLSDALKKLNEMIKGQNEKAQLRRNCAFSFGPPWGS